MAFSFLNDSFDDLPPFASPNGSVDESSYSSFTRPTLNHSHASSRSTNINDTKANLHRRFTTNTVPTMSTLSPIGEPRRHAPELPAPQDLSFSINQKVQLLEKRKAEYDLLKKKKLQIQRDMEREWSLMDIEAKQNDAELHRLRANISQPSDIVGHESEPTTPPEYQDNGFPSVLSKPNRFSTSNLTSPPGISGRGSRPTSQITSPPNERARAYEALTSGLPAQSLPTSHRNSDEEDDEYDEETLDFNHRSAASLNRNSMPVTRRDLGSRNGVVDLSSTLGHVNTPAFLFGNDFDNTPEAPSTSSGRGYLQMHTNDEKFPILIRREGDGNGSSSSALDLAMNQTPTSEETDSSGWPPFSKRSARASMPPTQTQDQLRSMDDSPPFGLPQPNTSDQSTPMKAGVSNRHSMGAKIGPFAENKRHSVLATPPSTATAASVAGSAPKLNSSLSTGNVPTFKNMGVSNGVGVANNNQSSATAEQRLHNHNAILGRIPPNAINNSRHSRELSTVSGAEQKATDDQRPSFPALDSMLQANATPFGPGQAAPGYTDTNVSAQLPNFQTSPYGTQGYYNSYSMQMLNSALGNMQLPSTTPAPWNNQVQMFPSQQYQSYSGYQGTPMTANRVSDSQARVIQQRRKEHGEEFAKFASIPLENLQGEISGLCKDQHGCRYLQKKLEERKPEHIQMIFDETKDQIAELMTDPFGNYLCQKLLEYADDNQRTYLINKAAPSMVSIALNQHGTRALQKMIEYVNSPEQIHTVTLALKDQVVPMIQDLNGNHVIQKCLNRLTPDDAQFIFDSVAANCVTVGSHRHGTCVIQRCIDHAYGHQKANLIGSITSCALPLAQDPFGNYVIQYIFDQGEDAFSQPLCHAIIGNVIMLSKQKFSSNVVEKCLRIADPQSRHLMILELINSQDFERVADDIYSNYVVQTAWDYADPDDEAIIAEKIRPLLTRIRHKPYGRRFQNRLNERDKRLGISHSGTMTPLDPTSPETSSQTTASNLTSPIHHPTVLQGQDTTGLQGTNNNFAAMGNPTFGHQLYGLGHNFGTAQAQYPNANVQANMTHFQDPGRAQPQFPGYERGPAHHMNFF